MFPLNRTWARRLPRLNAIHRLVVVRVARWLRRQMVLDSPGGYDAVLYVRLGDWLEVQEESDNKGEGIMVSRSIRVLGLVVCLLACCCFVQAQDKPKESVIITVGFIADEYLDLFDTSYRPGVTAALNAKIAGDKTRLGGKFRFDKLDEIKAYSFGPELSHKISFVEPYAHFLIGFQTVPGVDDKEIIRTVGGGVRLNIGQHVVFNPLQIDFTNREKKQLSVSIGVRF